MDEPLADLADLQNRLDWDLSDSEKRMGQSALEDLSDDARGYGLEAWTSDSVPRQVRKTVLAAAVRYLRNPDGYVQSRAGDEYTNWNDKYTTGGSASFTSDEIALIEKYAGKSQNTWQSVEVVAWRSKPMLYENRYFWAEYEPGFGPEFDWGRDYESDPGLIPGTDGGEPFPYYADVDGPW